MSSNELKGFSHFGENLLDDQIRANLISFLDWGFLNKGNFQNVKIPASGIYGGNKETLQPYKDPRFPTGTVFQSFRSNWVWQSGLLTETQPIRPSGVYVNNTFYPSDTTGPYAHYIDYPRGRVVFNSPISTSSSVKVEYSHRFVNVLDANEVPFLREVQTNSFRLDSPAFRQLASGSYAVLPDSKIQMPFIGVEITSNIRFSPYCLGGGQISETKVICHIMSDDEKIAKKIATAIALQNEKTITTFDVNRISENNLSPITYKGSIAPGALTHPQMTSQYEWKKLSIINMDGGDGMWMDSVYYIPMTFDAEVIVNNI